MSEKPEKRSLPLLGRVLERGRDIPPASGGHPQPGHSTVGEVAIWYISNLQRCNFTCSYCASRQPELQKDGALPTWAHSPSVHETIVDWLIAQPFSFRLRMNSIGEPFVSAQYLQSVARLTRAANVSFVEILTNGSFRPDQFDRFVKDCNVKKLSLWITFHHEFITSAELVKAAAHAQARGAFVVVNALVFPDNAEAVSTLVQECEKNDIRVATGFGINVNDAYPSHGHTPALDNPTQQVLDLGGYSNALGAYHELASAPAGRACGAGTRYFLIGPKGQVFPCLTYANFLGSTVLGSALDPNFRLSPRLDEYPTCIAPGRCRCPEDYQNLEAIQQRFDWTLPSFGMPVPASA